MIHAIAFLAALQAPLAYAWSYNIVRTSNPQTPVADFHGVKVLSNLQRCTPLTNIGGNGEVDPATGMQIYQFAPQTFERQWARPVRYIAFWGDERCGGMPRYIVHWHDMVDTAQTILFDTIMEGSLGWGDQFHPILGVHSWQELPDGDRIWPGKIPQGGVAVLTRSSRPEELQVSYLVLKNVVAMEELISGSRRTMPRTDVKWGDYGTGVMTRPDIVRLSGTGREDTPSPVYQDEQEPVDNYNSLLPPVSDNNDDADEIQLIDGNQFRESLPRQAKPVLPPLENQAQRKNPVYNQNTGRIRNTPPARTKRRERSDTTKNKNLQQELQAQQDAYKNLQRQSQEQAQGQQRSSPNNQQGTNSQTSTSSPSLNFNGPDSKKLLDLREFWLGLGLEEELLVKRLKQLPNSIFLGLFQLAAAGRITIKQVAEYVLQFDADELQKIDQEQMKKAQLEVANRQELRNRWAQANQQVYQVVGQIELMRQLAQYQGLAQGANNWFDNYAANPYAGNAMNARWYSNPNMNSNMNIGGPSPMFSNFGGQQQMSNLGFQQMFGNPGVQQQMYGNQGQLYGNQGQMYGNQGQVYGNQGQMYGNQRQMYSNQGQMYGNQGQAYNNQGQTYSNQGQGYSNQMGQQGNYQPYQTQQTDQETKQESQIRLEDPFSRNLRSDEQLLDPTQPPRANHMPAEGGIGYLSAPPGTPMNPGPRDYSAGTNDYMEYLRMPNLMSQLPGFADAGQLGGFQRVTSDQLSELTAMLRSEGGGRPSADNAGTQRTGLSGGSTLAQMQEGMNAAMRRQENGGGMEEEVDDGQEYYDEVVKQEFEEF
ncbi:hypothetical protein TWF718_002460 [Orbilia javanica]|uniref:Uncharacterized protein n=1 Tax=Orbilia javanica TaxID=47235 RepID=A0AAN8R9X4_9PEZI